MLLFKRKTNAPMKRTLFFLFIGLVMISLSYYFIKKPVNGTSPVRHFNGTRRRYLFYCKELRYRNRPYPKPVALVSFPGSGSSWLRHLLQESTGYLTGSVTYDPIMMKKNFPAEGMSDGSVVVVKVLDRSEFMKEKYRAILLLVRNPMDAMLSSFNRLFAGPTGTANVSLFVSQNIDWAGRVRAEIKNWASFHEDCLSQYWKPVYIVIYEDLLKDTRSSLRGVLRFLEQNVTEEDFNCAITKGEGVFRRKKSLPFDPFTPTMFKDITQVKKKIMSLVERYKSVHHQTS